MSNPTSNFGWQMPTPTDLVTNLPADFEVFGQAVDSDFADLLGGTTGQILTKNSNTDLDFVWSAAAPGDITGVTAGVGISGGGTSGDVTVTNSMATAITTAGDLIKGTGSGTFARLGIGSTGQVLTVASGAPVWATPASSGGMTLLQTLTLSGNSVTSSTFSSSYKQIVCFMNAVGVSGNAGFRVRPNSTSTPGSGEYNTQTIAMQDGTNVSGSSLNYAYGMILGAATDSADANKRFSGILTLMKPSDTTCIYIQSNGMSYEGTGTKMFALNTMANMKTTAAITTLEFKADSGNYTYGTIDIYGVN